MRRYKLDDIVLRQDELDSFNLILDALKLAISRVATSESGTRVIEYTPNQLGGIRLVLDSLLPLTPYSSDKDNLLGQAINNIISRYIRAKYPSLLD